ncbi:LacI family DNA-binding transcriptional regulator [Microbacterium sp. P01]|uniref:LacI family DNA-binding transcriptional regulator n=1 Tax=unclassified Microbacterium TaxID=2609290 RepID=UPI00367285B9
MPPRVTLDDVAVACGVSVSTVSRALAGRGDLDPSTRARVSSAARSLGYSRDGDGRGRPRGARPALFDLVLGHFDSQYAGEVTAGAQRAAAEAGGDLVLTIERDAPDDDWPARIRARGSSGAVLGLILPTRSQLAVLADAGIPLVLLDPRGDESLPVVSVRTTDESGGRAAGEHLVQTGARRFIVVSGTPTYRFGRARADGFVSAVRAAIPDAPIQRLTADWGERTAFAAARRAFSGLDTADGPVGVFACADEMAYGVCAAAADRGLRVPEDVRVVGFDDLPWSRRHDPPLTTVRQPIRAMAAAAVRALAAHAAGAPLERALVELPATLIARRSTEV